MAPRQRTDEEAFPYKMKDLCELTGVERQAVHFYIQEGLVPEGHKTGRNMAYYGERHVERIRLIKKLQEEQFLPLKAIRAIIEERDETFSPAQKQLLSDVKDRLRSTPGAIADRTETVPVSAVLEAAKVDRRDFEEMVEIGIIATTKGPKGRMLVSKEDAWIVELWGRLRSAGFTRELGFSPRLMTFFEEAIASILQKEVEILHSRLGMLPAEQLAAMVARALPLVGEFLLRLHENKIRTFIATASV
jgi:DNA-binding transcriptional MerR regulator